MDDTEIAALDRARYISLATFRRSGTAVETPVWFAVRNGRLYVFSAGDAGKVKRLRNDPRIRIAVCDVRGRVRGTWREGSARRVDDPDRVEAAYDALLRKYGWQMHAANWMSRLSGRIHRRAVLELTV